MSGKSPMTNGSGLRQNGGMSRLATIQAQFQQKQMAEKEAKLLAMLDNQQQKMIQHTNGLLNKYNNNTSAPAPAAQLPQGKVRQMFEERRKGGSGTLSASNPPKGIDKAYPLDPIASPPLTVTKTGPAGVTSGSNRTTVTTTRNAVNAPAPIISRKPVSVSTTPSPSPSPATFSNSKPVTPASIGSRSRGSASSSASSGSAGRPSPTSTLPPAASTTKYSEYASELERREATLSNKLKGLDIEEKKTRSPASSSLRNKVAPSPAGTNANVVGSKASKTPPPRPKGSPPPGLNECKMCGRFFAPDRIAKHESICKKVGVKKRKVFDPTKMRMQGTEAEPYIRIVSAKPKVPPKAAAAQQGKKADWRKKHEDFIATIRAAKEYQAHVAKGGNPADLPPPPPTDTSDYIQCPHCGRKFSQGAAERHIPKCKNIKSNKR